MEGIGRDRLFIGALKLLALPNTIRCSGHVNTHYRLGLGSTLKGASNAEPHMRTESGIAAIEKLGIAHESSFSASKNKCSTSPVFLAKTNWPTALLG